MDIRARNLVFAFLVAQYAFIPAAHSFLSDVKVQAAVEAADANGNLTYRYRLSAGASSTENLWWYAFDIARDSEEIQLPEIALTIDNSGSGPGTNLTEYRESRRIAADSVNPTGCEAPTGWVCEITRDSQVSWAYNELSAAITPGSFKDGVVAHSPGIPRIVDAVLRPLQIYNTAGDSFEEGDRVAVQQQVEESRIFLRVLAPAAPRKFPQPLTVLENLRQQILEAYTLGWISDLNVRGDLLSKITEAKNYVIGGYISDARNQMVEMNNYINPISCKVIGCSGLALSSDAYGLVFFNSAYLQTILVDADSDGIIDIIDNCPQWWNKDQSNADEDDLGDLCDFVCSDGLDNDSDGQTDWPADTNCSNIEWISEDVVSGGGGC